MGPRLATETGPTRRSLLGRRDECEVLDQLLDDALAGHSRVLVLRGDPGVGKSALLEYLSGRVSGWRVERAFGVESEMELAYSGLHQLCTPMLEHIDRLPEPQRTALGGVFGLNAGPPPDRFLVGLATLTLFAEVAESQPLACLIDDAQWLDDASAQILGFVARRLLAERVAIVCTARSGSGDRFLADQPAVSLAGLVDADARALLLENLHAPIDEAVRDRIVKESHGNPLALLELPRTWSVAELAGGFGFPSDALVARRIEQSYARRLDELPADTRLLVLTASADPLGDPTLLYRAVAKLGLDQAAADAAADAGLLEIGSRAEFVHPLARSAAYRSASAEDRRRVHRALAESTDGEQEPDRRAWHLACGTTGPDDEVADELERSADRAASRGGLAARAAFLQRAAALTREPTTRSRRALAAAELKSNAGLLDDALGLVALAEAGDLDALQGVQVLLLRARVAFASRRRAEGLPLLVEAAREAERTDIDLARRTYLEAFHAAMHSGRFDPAGLLDVSRSALACARPDVPGRPRDLLLDGLAARVVDGYAAGAPILKEALAAFRRETQLAREDAAWLFLTFRVASDLWDDESHVLLSSRALDGAREAGALAEIPRVLATRITGEAVWGRLDDATSLEEEMRAVISTTGIAMHSDGEILVAALRGRDEEASRLIARHAAHAETRREGLDLASSDYATAILCNGLGRYAEALAAVRDAVERPYEIGVSSRAAAEAVEAATRTGDNRTADLALVRLAEMARASGTPWVLGVEARSRALVSDGVAAENLYREALEQLATTRLRPELARAHLVYGEWLRREGRRVDARAQLRAAHDLFVAMGMEAFAVRAQRELAATGETARKRNDGTRADLTPQETQIARLAAEGLTNPQIGAKLFLSPRTIEWHLRRIYPKLGIKSRRELHTVMPLN
jgi:DNA-binding CsgD family transcriptional regulator